MPANCRKQQLLEKLHRHEQGNHRQRCTGHKSETGKNFAEFAKGKTEYEGVVERIDEIIAKRMPVTRQLNYLYEALSGAIEFGSRT